MRFLCLLTFLLFDPFSSFATSITWTNTVGGDWNVAQNWNPNQVPGSNDTATISATVPINVVISTTNFLLGLTLNLSNSLTILSNGALNILGQTSIYGALTNSGTVNWQSGNLNVLNNGSSKKGLIWNNAGALWDIQCDQTISVIGSGMERFNNSGLLRKSAGTNTVFPIYLVNSGTIEAQSGSLVLKSSGIVAGTLMADAGASLYLTGGTIFPISMNNPICLGPGRVGAQGAADLVGSFSGTFNNYDYATFGATSLPVMGLPFTFTVPTNAVLNLLGLHTIIQGPFTNQGTVNWQSGDLQILNNGTSATGEVWNSAGAVWDIQCDQPTTPLLNSGLERFHNYGLFRKSVTTGTTMFKFNFDNQGTVQVQSGLIEFTNTYSSTPAANLSIALGGLTPGANFGHVQIDVAPVLGGSFTVATTNGYRPNPGDSFQVLSYPSATGDFSSINGLDLGGGLRLEPHFDPQGLTLVAANYATNAAPALSLFHANSGFLISWPASFNGWQLYSTPDLASPNWMPVTAAGQNNTILSNVQQQFFRLQSSQ